MKRSKELYVDNKRYYTTQYSAVKGLSLLIRLMKIVGKPIGILVVEKPDNIVTPQLVASVVDALIEHADENNVISLITDIISTTEIIDDSGKHRPIVLNTDFAGAYGHLFKLLREILLFQYGDFFGGSAEETIVEEPALQKIKIK